MNLWKKILRTAFLCICWIPGVESAYRRAIRRHPVVDLGHFGACVEREIEVFSKADLRYRQPLATPKTVYHHQSSRKIVLFRNVTVWIECSLVFNNEGRIVRESALSSYRIKRLKEEHRASRSRKTMRIRKPCAVIEQGTMDNYYHWNIDLLPRLYALHDTEFRSIPEIVLLTTDNLDSERRAIVSKLIPDNVRMETIASCREIRADQYIHLPYLSDEWAGHLPERYLEWFREKMSAIRASFRESHSEKRRRIFVSRRDADVRRIENEEALVTKLADFGFERIVPGEFSQEQQIEIFSEAEIIVGMHGAGLTNMIFATGAKVLEIFPSNYPGVNHYRLLAAALGHEYANLAFGRIYRPDELQVPWKVPYDHAQFDADVFVNPDTVIKTLDEMGVKCRYDPASEVPDRLE